MSSICMKRLGCATVLAALAWPAFAYFDHFLNGTIIGTLNKEQFAALKQTFNSTLSDTEDGRSVPFSLPATAGGKATEGTFTPLKTKTDKGDRCRKIRSDLRQTGKSERWTGWYCQQKEGDWQKRLIKD
ncbi:hypothetical protein SAMN05216345_10111 [Cupriavidus sp. YR651]|uniref:hypothetical protein n=1 Tax=Cupriavidus sp. YR651 TaxID=1855315 RepID=UPI00089167B9|nr:hypothetical protein [Cupriavidus sp. YR651]SDB97889.1 hypothetical protein SAMN05216345_10111 [Cupriavidus sp. YR651]